MRGGAHHFPVAVINHVRRIHHPREVIASPFTNVLAHRTTDSGRARLVLRHHDLLSARLTSRHFGFLSLLHHYCLVIFFTKLSRDLCLFGLVRRSHDVFRAITSPLIFKSIDLLLDT